MLAPSHAHTHVRKHKHAETPPLRPARLLSPPRPIYLLTNGSTHAHTLFLFSQDNFRTPQVSIVKMAVLMLGEMDYAATFHSHGDTFVETVFYKLTTYALLIAYLVLMSIVVLNLLVRITSADVITSCRSRVALSSVGQWKKKLLVFNPYIIISKLTKTITKLYITLFYTWYNT